MVTRFLYTEVIMLNKSWVLSKCTWLLSEVRLIWLFLVRYFFETLVVLYNLCSTFYNKEVVIYCMFSDDNNKKIGIL